MLRTLASLKEELKEGCKDVYARCPETVQDGILTTYRYAQSFRRYGREFRACAALLDRAQWYTPDQLRDVQATRLRALIAHVHEAVPYYRAVFTQRGIRPDEIRWPEDLQRLPILTKRDVAEHFDDLISVKHRRVAGHLIGTSGTTGTPLQFYWDRRREAMETALLLRHLGWAGFRRGEPKAVLRGLEVADRGVEQTRYWRVNRAENELLLSSSFLSEHTIPHYVEQLRCFRPAIIWGYPSSVYAIAAYLERHDARADLDLKGVFLSSEPVYDWQRTSIERAFEAPIFDWYGLSEGVISAGECERHAGYHVNVESGVMEVVRFPEHPHLPEIVATGLDNFMMPLIRYRTGDVGDWLQTRCACGRSLPLMRAVETKMEDTIVAPDGRWISPSVLTFPFKALRGIEKSQILQTRSDAITIRLVVTNGFSSADEQRLVEGMKTRLGTRMGVSVEYVPDIPRTAAGKYRWVISSLAPHPPLADRAEAGAP